MNTNFANSDKYRAKIHSLIPGGGHTYSKGDDQFPILSPAAISHGKGAYVWDIDNNKYLDCSMGLTSVSLGHAYEPVLERVKEELYKGVNFQRPAYIEMEAAEKFLSLVPGHDMIKFAKNGSVVTSAAVKLARAYTGRKLVAFPVDHPFYSYDDWFIGKSPCNKGVPEEISNLSVTYKSNDLNSLKELFAKYPGQIACLISEPERNDNYGYSMTQEETAAYLRDVIDLVHKEGAVYINDEMIAGFKSALPGSMAKFGIVPDLSTWGKGIANGFSFCALTGKKEIMELGGIKNEGQEKVFLISTTHGGETHALAAGIKTIEVFQEQNVVAHNHKIGDQMIAQLTDVLAQKGMTSYIDLLTCNWDVGTIYKDKDGNISSGLRTLMMQEMIKHGVLFQGIFIPCFSHTSEDVNLFTDAFSKSLDIYAKGLEDGYEKYLTGAPAKAVFRKIL